MWRLPGTGAFPRDYDARTDTVIDGVTTLEWQRTLDPGLYTHADALTYCEDLALDGKLDWRLPSRIELLSIVDFERDPTIDLAVFPGTPGVYFWTWSLAAGGTTAAWLVDFRGG